MRSVEMFGSFEHLANLFSDTTRTNFVETKVLDMPRDKIKKRGTGGMFRKGTKNGLFLATL